MFGAGAFLTGLAMIVTGSVGDIIQHNKQELENEKYRAGNYSVFYQTKYDDYYGRLISVYDIDKIEDEISKDYPNMNSSIVFEIARIAMAKGLMESETRYNYKVPEKYGFINFDKYNSDKFKKDKR